jgi:dual specificity MAP kinase phosphatase
LKSSVFFLHERLAAFPPAQGIYILYRRLIEQGMAATWLWIKDKIVRRTQGFSIPETSRVAPNLYVGGQHKRRGLDRMRDLGITAVVNMREEADDAERGVSLDHYLWLPTTDDAAPALNDLKQGAAFIHRHIEAGRGVYVHCASGVGRAPTMAAAYLVQQGAVPQAAWGQIRQKRPFIRPTPPQIEVVEVLARQRTPLAASDLLTGTATRNEEQDEQDDIALEDRRLDAARLSFGGASNPGGERMHDYMEKRRQMAFERIAGDPMLTGDLTDAEAKILLDWADEEAQRLAAQTAGMDEDAAWSHLDPRLRDLRRTLRRIAKESADAENTAEALRQQLSRPDYPET